MATTGIVNSTIFGVFVFSSTYKIISHMTDASFSYSHETRDVTTKDSAGWSESLEGLRSWTVSSSNMFAFDATYGISDLRALAQARTPVTLRWGTQVSGDEYLQGSAYIESIEESSPGAEDNGSYSVTFKGNGAITRADLT